MVTNSEATFRRALTDPLLWHYNPWRHESDAVERAYETWISCDSTNRELAYAGYQAALDQEELAAEAYRNQLAWVQRIAG